MKVRKEGINVGRVAEKNDGDKNNSSPWSPLSALQRSTFGRTGRSSATTYTTNNNINVLYLMFTSGSSGIPKCVAGSADGTWARLNWMWRQFPMQLAKNNVPASLSLSSSSSSLSPSSPEENHGVEDVCCFKTSIAFVDSICEMFGGLLCGVSTAIFPQRMSTTARKATGGGGGDTTKNILAGDGGGGRGCERGAGGGDGGAGNDTEGWASSGDISQLASFVRHHRVTRLTVVPAVMRMMLTVHTVTESAAEQLAVVGMGDTYCSAIAATDSPPSSRLRTLLQTLRVLVLSGEILHGSLLLSTARVLQVRAYVRVLKCAVHACVCVCVRVRVLCVCACACMFAMLPCKQVAPLPGRRHVPIPPTCVCR